MFAAKILYLFFSVAFACELSMLWLKCGWKQVLSYVLVFAGAGAALGIVSEYYIFGIDLTFGVLLILVLLLQIQNGETLKDATLAFLLSLSAYSTTVCIWKYAVQFDGLSAPS